MSKFSNRINRFFLRHRDKGIPNLMLYICLGNAVVTIMSLFNGGSVLYDFLEFDKMKILQGEVWRLLTFVLTVVFDLVVAIAVGVAVSLLFFVIGKIRARA